ncbi:MAG TPA: substrate-binding domain-containing protein [Acidobacteriaceae bacterium]
MRTLVAAIICSLPLCALAQTAQTAPPWSKGANAPAGDKGLVFHVDDIDNVPDLHGNPQDAKLVLYIGGNQFFVMPRLIAGFTRQHPELAGHIFYETLPPGILRKQMAAGNTITLGNLTLHTVPDVYEAGANVLDEMRQHNQVDHVVRYTTNTLEIMVAAGNPKHITGLKDLAAPSVRVSMPNIETEGVAKQIQNSLRKAGGDDLVRIVYEQNVHAGTTFLTQVHHRQTPMRILAGQSDAGVVWTSEILFQQKIGNPIAGVRIPDSQNTVGVYAAGMVANAPHAPAAEAWLDYLQSPEAQAAYAEFGFRPYVASAKHP